MTARLELRDDLLNGLALVNPQTLPAGDFEFARGETELVRIMAWMSVT